MTSVNHNFTESALIIAVDLQVDKVQFVSHIKQLPSPERRNAELALFCHQPQQAEAIYLQAGLVYRAIELNMNLFNWERYAYNNYCGPLGSGTYP